MYPISSLIFGNCTGRRNNMESLPDSTVGQGMDFTEGGYPESEGGVRGLEMQAVFIAT